MPIKNKLFNH